ncbi:MAG: TonB-dependent receptor [Casimicrobium sp.]
MIQKKQLAVAIAATFVVSGFAVAQQAQQPQKVEKVEVTGSNIKRVDSETVSPVDVITREEIQRSGKQTVAEVIRAIPQNTGSLDEKNTNSFAPGSAGISLRGLGQKATLVLMNGRRIAGYGLAQNIQESFVDLNSIPASAIERIEVLRDGASAIYGSDAIAGVVNFILRKDYRGAEVSAAGTILEQTSSGKEFRVSGTFGFGDIAADRYNVMATADYYKRGELVFSDVDFLKSYDRRRFPGGANNTSIVAGQFQSRTAVGGLLPTRAISECPGKVVNGVAGLDAIGITGLGSTFTADSTWCNYDLANDTTLSPKTERIGALLRGSFSLSGNVSGFAEAGYSKTITEQVFQRAFVRTTGFATSGQSIIPFTYRVILAPGQGGNPTNGNVEYRGNFWDLGPRLAKIDSEASRMLVGLEGYNFGWDWKTGLGYSQTETINGFKNLISQSGLNAAVASNSYNFDKPSTNSQQVRDSIKVDGANVGKSTMTAFDFKASRELFSLPGGPAGLALGLDYRREAMNIRPDARIVANDVLGRGQTSVDGSRTVWAGYGELGLPVTKAIEASLALRTEQYSDYGNSTVPKVGAKWKATDSMLVRASWGKGFRAPSLPEISKSAATFFSSVRDTPTCRANNTPTCPSTQISGVFSANPNLKPEKSDSLNVGFVLDVSKELSVGVDYFDIKHKDLISSQDFQSVVDGLAPGTVIRDPQNNAIVSVLLGYENLDSVRTKGFDVDVRWKHATSFGKFDSRIALTYISKYDQILTTGGLGYSFAGNNGPGEGYLITPRYKLNTSIGWERGPYQLTLTSRYLPGYSNTAGAASGVTVSEGGSLPDSTSSKNYLDLYGSYQATRDLKISGGIRNFTNTQPPFDSARQSTFTYAYEEYEVRGRMYQLGLTYKFR